MKDQELLKNVCADIYAITGIKPVIYDANMQVVYAHPLSMSAFCREVRRDPIMAEKCLVCDREGFAQCRKTGDICIYRCHMGFMEAAAPIMEGGVVIGYFLFGQLLTPGARDEVKYKITGMKDQDILLSYLQSMMEADEETILASARLMSMCASYIRLQQVIKTQHKEVALMIAEYIRQNYGKELTIPALCQQFGVSRGTLYQISKDAFGMGITDYIRQCRLDGAVSLLKQGNLPVYKIAETVGIPDANYLAKLIKKHTGLTPRALRRQAG